MITPAATDTIHSIARQIAASDGDSEDARVHMRSALRLCNLLEFEANSDYLRTRITSLKQHLRALAALDGHQGHSREQRLLWVNAELASVRAGMGSAVKPNPREVAEHHATR